MRRNCENKNSAERKQHPVREYVMRNEQSAAPVFLNFLKEYLTHTSMAHIF